MATNTEISKRYHTVDGVDRKLTAAELDIYLKGKETGYDEGIKAASDKNILEILEIIAGYEKQKEQLQQAAHIRGSFSSGWNAACNKMGIFVDQLLEEDSGP